MNLLLPLDWPDPIDPPPRPEPPPAPKVSSDLAADSWGDAEPRDDAEAARDARRRARRMLMVRAVALIKSKHCGDCRAAWREVRRAHEEGRIWLPANV